MHLVIAVSSGVIRWKVGRLTAVEAVHVSFFGCMVREVVFRVHVSVKPFLDHDQ